MEMPSCRDGENSILSRPNIQRESALRTAGANVVVVLEVAATAAELMVVEFVAAAVVVVVVVDTETTVFIDVTV